MLSGCARSLWRPLLLVTLAVAVLGMHHTPSSAPESPAPAHRTVAAGTHEGCCAPGPMVTAGAPDHRAPTGGHMGGHDLLHLCLAILAAIAGIGLVLFAVAGPPPTADPDAGTNLRRSGFARAPPLPTARRLAVLCVLRQ